MSHHKLAVWYKDVDFDAQMLNTPKDVVTRKDMPLGDPEDEMWPKIEFQDF